MGWAYPNGPSRLEEFCNYRLYKSTLWAKAGSVGSIWISTNKVVGGAANNSVESESQWTWCDYLVT